MRLSLLLVISFCAACGQSDPPPAPRARVPRPEPARVETKQATAPRIAPAMAPALTAEQARRYRSTLARARRHSRARQFSEALARFDELVALTPRSPRLLCEAGYVAHLAGDEDRAESMLRQGVALFEAWDPSQGEIARSYAMCLYNQGLVEEARGDAQRARRSYQRSLALRENRAVRARLGAIESDPEEGVVKSSLEEMIAFLEEPCPDREPDDEEGSSETEILARYPESGDAQAAVLAVDTVEEPISNTRLVLAVASGAPGALRAYELESLDSLSSAIGPEDFELEGVRLERIRAGDGWYWRVEYEAGTSESLQDYFFPDDENADEDEDEDEEAELCSFRCGSSARREVTVLCSASGLACAQIQRRAEILREPPRYECGGEVRTGHEIPASILEEYGFRGDDDFEGDDPEGDGEFHRAHRAEIAIEGGAVTLRVTEGELPDELRALSGTHPIAQFLDEAPQALPIGASCE